VPETKRRSRIFLIALGALGMLLCIALIVVIWIVRGRTDESLARMYGGLQEVYAKVESRIQEANEGLAKARQSLDELNDRVQQRVADLQDVEKEEAADIDEIERQIRARLESLRDWIALMRSTADIVTHLRESLDEASQRFQNDNPQSPEDLVDSVRAIQEDYEAADQLFAQVQQSLDEIRGEGNLEQRAARIETITSRADAALAKFESYGQNCEQAVRRMIDKSVERENRSRGQLVLYAALATAFLIWMAAGQLALICLGRKERARPN